MKVIVKEISIGDVNTQRVTALVKFTDDDRDKWIRSAKVEVSIPKETIMNVSLIEIEKKLVDQAYEFLSQALSARHP